MRKLLIAALVFLVLLTTHTGCNKPRPVVNDSIDSLSLRMGVLPTLDCLPFYIAEERASSTH